MVIQVCAYLGIQPDFLSYLGKMQISKFKSANTNAVILQFVHVFSVVIIMVNNISKILVILSSITSASNP